MEKLYRWVVLHHHNHGVSLYEPLLLKQPTEAEAIELIMADGSLYEPDKDEYITILGPCEIPTVCVTVVVEGGCCREVFINEESTGNVVFGGYTLIDFDDNPDSETPVAKAAPMASLLTAPNEE